MRRQNILVLLVAFIFAMAIGVSAVAVAPVSAQGKSQDLGKNWRVFNVKPDTNSYWDINKADALNGGVVQFPIQPFQSTTTGSFAVYLLNNYNVDMTGKTFSMNATWTPGLYKTRSTVFPGAYVRFEFQDVTSGPYDANDYWWSTGSNSLDLNSTSAGTLSVSLTDPSKWSNLCGKAATDTSAPYTDCITGAQLDVSPAAGFANAAKKVKLAGIAFGSAGSYASGVAIDGTNAGTFQVWNFTIQ